MTIFRGDEKYACEACIKGHRVSSCHHADRELQHVAKKGRPVSQCPHCRNLRKSRASHIKCVCADHNMTNEGPISTPPNGCECGVGQPCICGTKNFPLDTNEIPRAAMHKRAHSYNAARPVVARHSQTDLAGNTLQPVTPRFHPYMRHGASHSMTSFQTGQSQPPIDFGYDTQPSTPGSALSATPPYGHRAVRSEQSSPANGLLNSFLSPNHLPAFDNSQLSAYSSPHNQARYSVNDFSQFQHEEAVGASCAITDFQPQQMTWPPVSDDAMSFSVPVPSITAASAGQRSSICSMDQPGLTHSPSASTDTGESVSSDALTSWNVFPQGYVQNEVKNDPDWSMFNSGDFSNAGLCFRPGPIPQAAAAAESPDYFLAQHHGMMPDESEFLTPTGNTAGGQPGPAMAIPDQAEWRAPNFHLQLNTNFDRPGQAPKPLEYAPVVAPQQTYTENFAQYAPYYPQYPQPQQEQ